MANYTGDDSDNTFFGADEFNNAFFRGGNDFALGGELKDQFHGEDGNDSLKGYGGDDSLDGGDGDDYLDGGAGDDYLFSGLGNDVVIGGTGADAIYFYSGSAVTGGAGDDVLIGQYSADAGAALTTYGDAGDDLFRFSGATEGSFDGGTGEDTIDYADFGSANGVIVNLLSGRGGKDAAAHTYTLIEDASGTAHDDTLIGNGSINALYGVDGDDVLAGGGGGDYLIGGTGVNTLDYTTSPGAVRVDLAAGTAYGGDAQEDIFRDIQSITGSAYADQLTGDTAANVLRGGAGTTR